MQMSGSNKNRGGSKGPSTIQPKGPGIRILDVGRNVIKAGVQPAPTIKIGK